MVMPFLMVPGNIPDTLEMHRANLDHMAQLLALQNTITAATSHSRHIEQLGTVDHMVVCVCQL